MSVGSSSLGRRVLVLTTDATQLRQGLSQARALTIQQTADMKRAARVTLEADLLKLRADFQQAERLAQQTARQIGQHDTFTLRANLSQFQSDLRMAEREQAASIKRMQQQSGGGGGILGSLGGAVLQGVGIGTGIGLVTQGVGLAVQGVGAVAGAMKDGAAIAIDYNAAIEQSEARLRGYGQTAAQIAQTQAIANKAVDEGRGTYRETLSALADLTPLARTYHANLEDLLRTTQLLAATDPAQGFEGAAIALREALSGDFTSLQRRFEIPRSEIQKLKDQGVPNLEIVQRALAKLGINDNLLAEQANTFTQRLKILKDEAARTLAEALGGTEDFGKDALKGALDFLHDPATKAAVREFAAGLTAGLGELRTFLTDPKTKQGLLDLITATGQLTNGMLLLAAAVGKVAVPAFGLLIDDLNAAGDAYDALIDKLGKLPPTVQAQLGIAGLTDQGAVFQPGTVVHPLTGETGAPQLAPVPTTAATAPESETQFDITANADIGAQWAAQLQQARADLRAFASDWESEDFNLFDKLAPQVKGAFDQAFGGLDIQQQFEHGLGSLDGITARIVEDIQNTGKVSQETADLITSTLGQEAGNSVLALANQYAELAAATDKLKAATDELESAQHALSDAQKLASQHADEARERTDALQRSLSALSDEARDVAQSYADRLDAIREERQAAEDLAESHRKSYQAQIDGLASVQAAKQKSEAVANLTADQDKTLLSFEQRIRAARRPGGAGEAAARALEEERDRFLARSRYAIDLATLEAKVAQTQADKDSQAIQDKADAQAKVDQQALDDIDARAKKLQDEADQVARDYAARQRAIQDNIDAENERARIIAAADKKAIDDAQTRVENAQTAKTAAQDEAKAAQDKADAMEHQNTLLDGQLGKWKDFITYLQSLGIDVAKFFNGTGATGVGTPPPPNGAGGGTRGPGLPEALRVAPDTSYFRVPTYTPPVPPGAVAPGWAMAGGGGGASYLRNTSTRTITGPVLAMYGTVVREQADIDAIGATVIQALTRAEDEDGRAGGNVSWGRN